uniref:G_PROTEIN_RECEP_F1_2 domain-containing protein n=1 Tax=Bursaphelenchus xylophilus TaxID=6326 RepID=A0A1I7RWW3_BURXY
MNKIISNGPTIVVTGLAIISLMLAIRLPIKQKRRPSMEMSANIVNVLASFGFVLAIWIDCLVIWVDCKAIVFVGKVATFIGHLWLATASVRNRLDPTATKLNPWPHLRRNAIAYYAGGAAAASAVLLFELPNPNQLHFCLQKAPKSIQGVVGTSHNTHCAAYHRKPEKQVKHWGP